MIFVSCGGCDRLVPEPVAEICWYCAAYLCGNCWEEVGHCGHEEAERINRETKVTLRHK